MGSEATIGTATRRRRCACGGVFAAALRRWIGLCAAAALVAGCSTSLPNYEPRVHVVKRGETLYSIAFRYNLDTSTLARWNGIDNPNVIYTGQRLRLEPPRSRTVAARERPPPRAVPASRRSEPPPARPPPSRAPSSVRWAWPTDGPVVTPFGSTTAIASGIGIGGHRGQAVKAAAAGRVVYAGTGLIGYGQLIIIKHDDTYLSAYGYNDRLLVAQGDEVARGQKIAEMGLGPQREPRLHFEIRRGGTPVNPLQFVSGPG